jgi:hypothetical protein
MTVVESLLMKISYGAILFQFLLTFASPTSDGNGKDGVQMTKPDLASILGRSTTDFEIR